MREPGTWVWATAGLCALFLMSFVVHSTGLPNSIRTLFPEIVTVACAEGETGGDSLNKFKVEALHKAARISWTVSEGLNGPITFEVHRSMSSPDAEYILVTSVEWCEGTQKYKYVDKKLPAEENYFYKVVIPETNETYGPVQVRPPFSLPST